MPSWLRNSLERLQQRNRALRNEPEPDPPTRMEADGANVSGFLSSYVRDGFFFGNSIVAVRSDGIFQLDREQMMADSYEPLREARVRAAAERLSRPLRKPVGTPQSRAERLLRRTLPKKEWLRYMMKGYVLVRGSAGGLYRLRKAKANGVDQWQPQKRTICAVPDRVGELDPADMIVAQYLALKNDEPGFLRIALRSGEMAEIARMMNQGNDRAIRQAQDRVRLFGNTVLGLGFGIGQAAAAQNQRAISTRTSELAAQLAQEQMRMYEERFRPPPGFVEWNGSVRGRIYRELNLREPADHIEAQVRAAEREMERHGAVIRVYSDRSEVIMEQVVRCVYEDGYMLCLAFRDFDLAQRDRAGRPYHSPPA